MRPASRADRESRDESTVIDERWRTAAEVGSAPLVERCGPVVLATLSPVEAVELEELFTALADCHRVRIPNLLAFADDAACVRALTPTLGPARATVSYHLKLLVGAGLPEREQRGRFAYYRLVPGALDRVAELVRGTRPEVQAA